jgi:phosphoglycolate phosphatase
MSGLRVAAANVLFDLDGTLVDSAPAILATFQAVLDSHGIPPAVPLDRRLIGAPLLPTLMRLTGTTREGDVAHLADAFCAAYDGDGLAATLGYDSLGPVLESLALRGRRLYVVTNKRGVPARRILELLGVARYFVGIHALDVARPPVLDKSELVTRLLSADRLEAARCVLVGDTADDATAAWRNGLPFVAATYGYGSPAADAPVPPIATIASLRELPTRLDALGAGLEPAPAP